MTTNDMTWGSTVPALVLLERPDKSVSGVVLRCRFLDDSKIAQRYCEISEVEGLLAWLRAKAPDQSFRTSAGETFKDRNVDAPSLEEAVRGTPESGAMQKHLLVYRGCEWLTDIWTNPAKPDWSRAGEIHLTSVADFHGTRVSKEKLQQRAGLETVREKQVLAGDYALLEKALRIAGTGPLADCEQDPAVKLLCSWWNSNAPAEMQKAGLFRVYRWDAELKIFHAGDPEEPATQAPAMAANPTYALFEKEGAPTIVVQFFRGRAYNTEDDEGVHVYNANGESDWVIGCSLDDVDEAQYSIKGLRALGQHLQQLRTSRSE